MHRSSESLLMRLIVLISDPFDNRITFYAIMKLSTISQRYVLPCGISGNRDFVVYLQRFLIIQTDKIRFFIEHGYVQKNTLFHRLCHKLGGLQ